MFESRLQQHSHSSKVFAFLASSRRQHHAMRERARQKNSGVVGGCCGGAGADAAGVRRPRHLYDDNFDGVVGRRYSRDGDDVDGHSNQDRAGPGDHQRDAGPSGVLRRDCGALRWRGGIRQGANDGEWDGAAEADSGSGDVQH